MLSEKFENRKTLDTRLQEVDDARTLFEFFNGNGTWPFSSDDAENARGQDSSERD